MLKVEHNQRTFILPPSRLNMIFLALTPYHLIEETHSFLFSSYLPGAVTYPYSVRLSWL